MNQKVSFQANNRGQLENNITYQNWVTCICIFRISFVEALGILNFFLFLSHLKP